MKKDTMPFYPNTFFYIYNTGNNLENIFYSDRNYLYFLEMFYEYLSNYVKTYSYSLIFNQFRILIKTPDEVNKISNQFRKLFITYAMSVNIQQNRIGSLFLRPFRRKPITDVGYLQRLIYNIHSSPVHQNLCENYENYKWSSYQSIITETNVNIKSREVFELFGGREKFVEFHKNHFKYNNEYSQNFDLSIKY